MTNKKLMVMAGGTGGHIFPGLAVANYLIQLEWKILWLGTAERMESHLVPKHGIDIKFIRIRGLRNQRILSLLASPVKILYAWYQARKIIQAWKPDVVLGMGGYVSGPGALAAWSCGVPLILHEQNGVAGLTNKWLSRIASKVIQAFPGALSSAEVVGNPIREDLLALPEPSVRFSGRKGSIRVLVLGGSQGASILNQTMPQVAAEMGEKIKLWHQVGKGSLNIVSKDYAKLNCLPYIVSEFIDDIAAAYSWADVVICRSGAMTVSEISAVGLPAIFVPFQHKDRQQYWNALQLARIGGAVIYEQKEFTADIVSQTLEEWDRDKLLIMAEKSRSIAILDATTRVSSAIKNAVR
ncbi:UDP-N-acetylglucosamine--N-acetylmuramyl-(pentapeptide) pyrophosphoryl-undecaprenol N-acetylglucosamine transferase [Candidatus Erwinia haradaeae]|uniref:UDP-N-acetylglucosamine--N-acetylmuramyl-(pentapeptide) pyrophosphoryl-undecaprenol N-acetylglucosamine transferase n=1 Tax=Candidatus Erwinia haradaeae TaxID=1922217 RepID=A0A451D4B2_9GAMM|nr:UDP-N-acetylglucosamine--N-acetylmuramyl-(pentapeptide) pyrophosphoryl-undecaprenol N-acetylglucosamine transferase [Candidatus Erwinia haradaeae]